MHLSLTYTFITMFITGVNPDNPDHSRYLDQLCENFEDKMTRLIIKAVHKAEQQERLEPLNTEVLQHHAFRQFKCKSFTGRETILDVRDKLLFTLQEQIHIHGMWFGCKPFTI